MSVHVSYMTANRIASEKTLQNLRHKRSSGWKYVEFGVRRKWKLFWEVYAR